MPFDDRLEEVLQRCRIVPNWRNRYLGHFDDVREFETRWHLLPLSTYHRLDLFVELEVENCYCSVKPEELGLGTLDEETASCYAADTVDSNRCSDFGNRHPFLLYSSRIH